MKHTVLVTGASRGIGAAIAAAFAQDGHRVAIHYHEQADKARALCESLLSRGFSAMTVAGDISSEADVADIHAEAERRFGFVDVLINNAGVALPQALLTACDLADWNRVFAVNTTGMFLMSRAVIPAMVSHKRGSIVNLSSVWGVTGGSCEVPYSASKAAVIGLTKSLSKELAPSNIRVNCVAPGLIQTDMNAALDEAAVRAFCAETPLMRAGTPEEVAQAVLFLATERASFITGQTLCVDGGACI